MGLLETLMYEIARLFLMPVLILILLLFAYALYALGAFVVVALQRRGGRGADLHAWWLAHGRPDSEAVELQILKRLEPLRITSRAAPMLGLVATMIPMGPALMELAEGDVASVSENLVVAFAAVILALLAASISFTILTVRRRWLLSELYAIENATSEAVDQGATA